MKKLCTIFIFLSFTSLYAESFKIASVAGYKQPIQAVVKAFQSQNSTEIDLLFGNVRQTLEHAKNSNVALVVADKNHLNQVSTSAQESYTPIGQGTLVLAFAKGIKHDGNITLLQEPFIRKIAMPQPQKAIYGIAGEEMLEALKLKALLKEKLYVVATVPQVVLYLSTQEVEVGIINKTAYLANQKRLGSMIEVDATLYTPIEIVVSRLTSCTNTCQHFVEFLNTSEAQDIFKAYGL